MEKTIWAIACSIVLSLFACPIPVAAAAEARVPVIFDTDIGDDIDDTWATVMLLKSPQLDVKLVTTDCHAAEVRGRLLAKLLTVAGRTDIPVGLGPGRAGGTHHDAWVKDFALADYEGTVLDDGVQAIIDAIHKSPIPITVICVGPVQTMAAALEKDPSIAAKAHFVGMHGSVYKGYGGRPEPSAEYNVKRDATAARRVLSAPWRSATITPLDTCGIVRLDGERFARLRRSDDPLLQSLMENYRIWAKKGSVAELDRSSILFDTVAIYLAYPGPKKLVTMERLPIHVTDSGHTRVDAGGRAMDVAVSWTDLDAYHDLLVDVLLGPIARP